jgi:hypothetical protein
MSLGAPHRHRGGDIPQRAGVLDAITDRLVLGKPPIVALASQAIRPGQRVQS